MQPLSTYSGMCHVNLREAYIEDTDRLTETMQGEALAFSGIFIHGLTHEYSTNAFFSKNEKTTINIRWRMMISQSIKAFKEGSQEVN